MVSKSQVMGAYHGKLRALSRMGIDLTVVTPPRWGKQPLEISKFEGYKVRVVRCLLSGYPHFYFYTHTLGSLDADLVHLEEEPWSLANQQWLRKCVKENVPAIFFTWQNIFKKYPEPFAHFERYAHRHACAAIAGNREAKIILQQRGFGKRVAIIPQLGVDPGVFRKEDSSRLRCELRLEDRFIVGYVGRIVDSKGISDLIRSLTLLPESCALVLVGDGEFRLKAEKLADDLGVSTKIRWLPWVGSLEVPQYMNVFDVLVLPSRTTKRWKEQFGHVLIEAMACETPVVGSSSGEIPNVIGNAGLLFEESDVEGLAAHLNKLHDDADYRARLGKAGRLRVLSEYTDDRIAEQTMDVYSSVLKGALRNEESTFSVENVVR